MAEITFDDNGRLEEPCLSCDKCYVEDIWHEWSCDEKECVYKTERSDEQMKEIDNVNHPQHYEGNIECIDAMEEAIGINGVISFCIGNAFKYIWRCKKKHKSPIEDLKKAQWYINKTIELLEREERMDERNEEPLF